MKGQMQPQHSHGYIASALYAVVGALTGQGAGQLLGVFAGAAFQVLIGVTTAVFAAVAVHYVKRHLNERDARAKAESDRLKVWDKGGDEDEEGDD